jgi:hypothetical protein
MDKSKPAGVGGASLATPLLNGRNPHPLLQMEVGWTDRTVAFQWQ